MSLEPATDDILIRAIEAGDIAAICSIYNYYIENTIVSFEESAITETEMRERVDRVQTAGYPWLVAQQAGRIVGYSYGFRWRERSAYRFSAEVTVYLDKAFTGAGLGTSLYQHLFGLLREMGITTVIGGIGLPNPGSVALHEKMGLQQAATFRRVGFKFGEWLDVGYWQGEL